LVLVIFHLPMTKRRGGLNECSAGTASDAVKTHG